MAGTHGKCRRPGRRLGGVPQFEQRRHFRCITPNSPDALGRCLVAAFASASPACPRTRSIRLVFTLAHARYVSQAGAYLTDIAAQLTPRSTPPGSLNLLSAVDGPLPGASDTTRYAYDAAGKLTSVTDPVGLVTKITARNAAGQPTTIIGAAPLSRPWPMMRADASPR